MIQIRTAIFLLSLHACLFETVKAQNEQKPLSQMSWMELSEHWQSLCIAGKYEASLPFARAALEKARLDSTENSLDYGSSLDNLGFSLHHTCRHAEAEKLFLQAVEHADRHLGRSHEDYITRLSNLAMLHIDMGELAKAASELSAAVDLGDKYLESDNPYLGVLVNNLGLAYELMGDYEHALPCYYKALDLTASTLGKDNTRYATRLFNIAAMLRKKGKNDEALDLSLQGLAIFEKQCGKNHPLYIKGLQSVMSSYMSLSRYPEALSISDSLLVLAEANDYRNNPDNFDFAQSIAALYYRTGQYERCLNLSRESFEKCRSLYPKFYTRISELASLAMLSLEKMNQKEAARQYALLGYQFAIAELRQTFRNFSEKEQLRLYAGSRQWTHRSFLLFAMKHPEFPELAAASYEYQMTIKGLSMFNRQQLLRSLEGNPEGGLAEQFRSWSGLSEEISRQQALLPAKRAPNLDSLCVRANELERNLAIGSSVFQMANEATHWEDVRSVLQPGEAAIEFNCMHTLPPNLQPGNDSVLYEALILRPEDKFPLRVPLFEEKALNQLHGTRHLYDPLDRDDKSSLASLIWQPLSAYLTGTHTIYYAPAGLLYQVNLDAVPVSADEIMAGRFRMHRLVSTRQLTGGRPDREHTPPATALVLGGIRYDADSTASSGDATGHGAPTRSSTFQTSWPFLDGSLKEVTGVKKQLESIGTAVAFADGLNASEAFFKSSVGRSAPEVLHLATHGFFVATPDSSAESGFESSTDPMARAGLVLAGANRVWNAPDTPEDQEDGILTALEISHLNLKGAQLAVLSACSTGQGKLEAGEGILGLQRAFKMAGVRYVVLSLWNVQDRHAQEFVSLFYDEWLTRQKTVPEAFREAQKQMRSRYARPFQPMAWAGFLLLE